MREFVYLSKDSQGWVHLIEATPEGPQLHVIKGGKQKLISIIKKTRGYKAVCYASLIGKKTGKALRKRYGEPQHYSKKLEEKLLAELHESYAIQTIGPSSLQKYCEQNQGSIEPNHKWRAGIANAFLRQIEKEPGIIGIPFKPNETYDEVGFRSRLGTLLWGKDGRKYLTGSTKFTGKELRKVMISIPDSIWISEVPVVVEVKVLDYSTIKKWEGPIERTGFKMKKGFTKTKHEAVETMKLRTHVIGKNFGINHLYTVLAIIGVWGEEAYVRVYSREENLSTRNVKTFELDDQDITDIVRDAMAEPRNPMPKN